MGDLGPASPQGQGREVQAQSGQTGPGGGQFLQPAAGPAAGVQNQSLIQPGSESIDRRQGQAAQGQVPPMDLLDLVQFLIADRFQRGPLIRSGVGPDG